MTSDQICFKGKYQNVQLHCARQMAEQVLALPVYENLQMKEVEKIIRLIEMG